MTFTLKQLDEAMNAANGYTRLEGGLYGTSAGTVVLPWGDAKTVDSNRTLKEYGEDSTKHVTFTVAGRYFRKDGYYSSWDDGNEFEKWDGELVELSRVETVVPAHSVVTYEPKVVIPFTAVGVQEFIDSGYDRTSNDQWYDFASDLFYSNPERFNKMYESLCNEFVAEFGDRLFLVERTGESNHGSALRMVFRIGDRHFMRTGYYNSWDSNEWDGPLVEVEPYTKTVTDYREIS